MADILQMDRIEKYDVFSELTAHTPEVRDFRIGGFGNWCPE